MKLNSVVVTAFLRRWSGGPHAWGILCSWSPHPVAALSYFHHSDIIIFFSATCETRLSQDVITFCSLQRKFFHSSKRVAANMWRKRALIAQRASAGAFSPSTPRTTVWANIHICTYVHIPLEEVSFRSVSKQLKTRWTDSCFRNSASIKGSSVCVAVCAFVGKFYLISIVFHGASATTKRMQCTHDTPHEATQSTPRKKLHHLTAIVASSSGLKKEN